MRWRLPLLGTEVGTASDSRCSVCVTHLRATSEPVADRGPNQLSTLPVQGKRWLNKFAVALKRPWAEREPAALHTTLQVKTAARQPNMLPDGHLRSAAWQKTTCPPHALIVSKTNGGIAQCNTIEMSGKLCVPGCRTHRAVLSPVLAALELLLQLLLRLLRRTQRHSRDFACAAADASIRAQASLLRI